MLKILIIDPPFYRLFGPEYGLKTYPLGLGYLGAYVAQHSQWQVRTLQADFNPHPHNLRVSMLAGEGFQHYRTQLANPQAPIWREIAVQLAAERPDVVGISITSAKFAGARHVARLVRELLPKAVVIAGGPHATVAADEILAHPEFNLCVRREGELTLTELLEHIASGKKYQHIAGISYRAPRTVQHNPDRPFITDLDALPFPFANIERILIGYDRYRPDSFANVLTARGCPFSCCFCSSQVVWSRRVRSRSVASILAEIDALHRRGVHYIRFQDDTFGIDSQAAIALCQGLAKICPRLCWSCEIHPVLVTDELLAAMKQAGCVSIQIGIESGDNAMLQHIRKGVTVAAFLEVCRKVRTMAIDMTVFYMVGFPWETRASIDATLRLIKKVDAEVSCYSIFVPYRGTDAYDYCMTAGLIDAGFATALHYHQSPENCFVKELPPAEFRPLAAHVEHTVDTLNNRSHRLRHYWRKIRYWGIGGTMRKISNRLRGPQKCSLET